MPGLFIRDAEIEARAQRLSKRLGKSKTEIIRAELKRLEDSMPPEENDFERWLRIDSERFPPLKQGLIKADKAFFDDLSGDL